MDFLGGESIAGITNNKYGKQIEYKRVGVLYIYISVYFIGYLRVIYTRTP